MVHEIELKVRVDDPAALEEKLKGSCVFVRTYDKFDTYYSYPCGPEEGKAFRLRKDGGGCIVTVKEKKVLNGIEHNMEREFSVSSEELFTYFILSLGCSVKVTKRKKGSLFKLGDINLELSRVERLGWFLEVEKICGSNDPAEHEMAKKEILAVLKRFGIPEDRIEARYYTDMLLEA